MINRPLYAELSHQTLAPQGHIGLYYDKFMDTWDADFTSLDKPAWLRRFSQLGDAQWILAFAERQATLARHKSGLVLVMENTSQWLIGQGHSHPTEVGLLWHPTLGTPYLPGSSIKGALRAWADRVSLPDIDELFGVEKLPHHVGSIIVADAIPLHPVKLSLDMMNPHYGPWYRREPKVTPDDRQQPVPIFFLTVSPHQPFLFSMMPRTAYGQSRLNVVRDLLIDALQWGIGAKTAIGFGSFRLNESLTLQWQLRGNPTSQSKSPTDGMSLVTPPVPVSQYIWDDMVSDGYPNERFIDALTTKWLDEMEKSERPLADRVAIAQLLAHWYQTVRPSDWARPQRKNLEKVRRIQTALDRKEFLK